MREDISIVWIDDNPDREGVAENLAAAINVHVKFIDVNKREFEEQLKELISKGKPDMVILDHSLDQTKSETIRKGSTAATIIHEYWPSCPIISVTAVDKFQIDYFQRSAYEAIFPVNRISNNYETIKSIVVGFRKMNQEYPKNSNELLNLIEVPKEEYEKIYLWFVLCSYLSSNVYSMFCR